MLEENGLIDEIVSLAMQKMVGFRNISVHDYQDLNLQIVERLVEKHLSDFTDCTSAVLSLGL